MRILIAADRGENFNGALEFLKSGTLSSNNAVKLVYAVEPSDVSDLWLSMSGATRYRSILAERQEHALQILKETSENFKELLGASVDLEISVLVGHVSEIVVRTATEWAADLVVVGLPESTFISRCIPSRTFARVVAGAPCPVTFARMPGQKAG